MTMARALFSRGAEAPGKILPPLKWYGNRYHVGLYPSEAAGRISCEALAAVLRGHEPYDCVPLAVPPASKAKVEQSGLSTSFWMLWFLGSVVMAWLVVVWGR